MAFIQMEFYSAMLTRHTEIAVILPESRQQESYPVLWLLHGACDNDSGWWRNTAVELYAEQHGVAVVMPSGDNSFYSNGPLGRYFDYVADELYDKLCTMMPLSRDRADHVVGGLSMGGHGAYKLGLMRPDRYAGIAVLSAGNFIDLGDPAPGSAFADINQKLFGTTDMSRLVGTEHDIVHLGDMAAQSGAELPELYVCCGTEDLAFGSAQQTYLHMTGKLGMSGQWHARPGKHDWAFWGMMIPEVMAWCAQLTGRSR